MKKGLLIGSLAVLLVAGAGVAVVGVGSGGFKNWDTNTWFDDLKSNVSKDTISIEGATAEEVIVNLSEGKTWSTFDDTNSKLLCFDILTNYNSFILNDSDGYKVISLRSNGYKYYPYTYSNLDYKYSFQALGDCSELNVFDLNSNEVYEKVMFGTYQNSTLPYTALTNIMSYYNAECFSYLKNSGVIDPSDQITIDITNLSYLDLGNFKVIKVNDEDKERELYFLPNDLKFNLDFKSVTGIETVPEYDDHIKEALGNFFVME